MPQTLTHPFRETLLPFTTNVGKGGFKSHKGLFFSKSYEYAQTLISDLLFALIRSTSSYNAAVKKEIINEICNTPSCKYTEVKGFHKNQYPSCNTPIVTHVQHYDSIAAVRYYSCCSKKYEC